MGKRRVKGWKEGKGRQERKGKGRKERKGDSSRERNGRGEKGDCSKMLSHLVPFWDMCYHPDQISMSPVCGQRLKDSVQKPGNNKVLMMLSKGLGTMG